MPFDVNQLLLPLTRAEHTELPASDERLLALDALATKGDFAGAALGVEELLEAGIYDIRALPYYFYQLFVTDGYAGLLTVLKITENLVGPSLSVLDPERRREDYINRRCHWLFDKIDSSLAYHTKGNTPELARWRSAMTPALLEELLLVGARVVQLFTPPSYLEAGTALGHVVARLRGDEQAAASEVPDKNKSLSESSSAVSSDANPPQSVAAVLAARLTSDHTAADGLQRVELFVSPRFLQLCRSLEAFEVLIRKEHFAKAAVVLADISESLGHFDPRAHFPSLFAQFASLHSKHVRALSEHTDAHDSPAWQALQQYYQVDLKGFVES